MLPWSFIRLVAWLSCSHLSQDHVTDVLTGLPNLEDLGVELTQLEDRADYELKPHRLYAYYEDKLGEFPKPAPPEKVLGW